MGLCQFTQADLILLLSYWLSLPVFFTSWHHSFTGATSFLGHPSPTIPAFPNMILQCINLTSSPFWQSSHPSLQNHLLVTLRSAVESTHPKIHLGDRGPELVLLYPPWDTLNPLGLGGDLSKREVGTFLSLRELLISWIISSLVFVFVFLLGESR